MKAKLTLLAGLAALAMTGAAALAQAPIVIYIAGANGDRATTNTAIPKLLGGTVTHAGIKANPTQSNVSTFTGGTFTGGTFTNVPVTIKVSYIGATGGIAAVAGSQTVRFLPDGATGGANADPTDPANPAVIAIPSIALSTNFQSSSPFIGTYQGIQYEDLSPQDQIVSVVGVKWIASKGFPGDNITPLAAQLLFKNGRAPLSAITGDPNDNNKTVFATGRNLDAGQRFAAQAEAGIGIFSVVRHYKPTISGAAAGVGNFVTGGTVDSHALWPVETFSGVSSQILGNSGATTGANVAPILTATLGPAAYTVGNPNATAGYYISYLTPGDADTIAIPNGAVELKWNGVPYSPTAVREGRYFSSIARRPPASRKRSAMRWPIRSRPWMRVSRAFF